MPLGHKVNRAALCFSFISLISVILHKILLTFPCPVL